MTTGQPERADADPGPAQNVDARKKGDVARPHATRGPESGDTSQVVDAASGPGLPFEQLPVEFGRYRIEKLLGSGAMGAVYLAHDSQLDRPVALKVPKLAKSGAAALLKRMEREAKALAQLDHPNICKVYDFDERQGVRYMALEYVEGETLKSLLQRLGRKRKPAEAVAMIGQLARALGAAHEKGVVHRDLKPENIMRRPDGRLVIMDFGLNRQSRLGEEAALKTQAGTVLGTPAYMSPEQAAGRLEQVDQRSDIYALGVMLYEMLTGELPFSGTALEIMGKKALQAAPSPLTVNPKLPEGLASICDRLLSRARDDRPATSGEVAAMLKACDLTPRAAAPQAVPTETVAGNPLDFLAEPEAQDATPVARGTKREKASGREPRSAALSWWSSLTVSLKLCLAGAVCVVGWLLGMILLEGEHGTLRIEIDDPALTVKLAGETITVDNDGTPIRIRAASPQSFEVWQNGVLVDTAAREVSVRANEDRLLRVSLVDGKVAFDQRPSGSERGAAGELAADSMPRTPNLPSRSVDDDAHSTEVAGLVERKNDSPLSKELPSGRLHDLLAMIRVSDHALSGRWTTGQDGITCQRFPDARILVPVVVEGDYTVKIRFTRRENNNAIGMVLPVGGRQVCVQVDIGAGRFSGTGHIDDRPAYTQGGTSIATEGRAVTNGTMHEMTVAVKSGDGKCAITGTLDGRQFTDWSGAPPQLSIWSTVALPNVWNMCLMAYDSATDFHALELVQEQGRGRAFELAKEDWLGPWCAIDNSPPADVSARCVVHNGKSYLFSDQALGLPDAQIWAREHKGRLVTISSAAEDQLLRGEARGRGFWMAGWRPADASAAWRDERNRPLRYLEGWFPSQPDIGYGGEWNLSYWTNGTPGWHDVPTSISGLHACIEWGEEYEETVSPSPASPVQSGKPSPPADSIVFGNKGRRFKLFRENLSWHEAVARCREMGGNLVVIHAAGKNDFIRDLAQGTDLEGLWLGATDEDREGQWHWLGTEAPDLTFKKFSRGQPDNAGAGEHFLAMTLKSNPGEWIDLPDRSPSLRMGFVCEWAGPDVPKSGK